MRTALGLLLLLFLSSPLAASERATGSFKDEFRNETRLHNLKKEDADVWRNEEGGDLRKYIPDDAKEDQNPQPKNSTTSQGSGRDMIISAVTSTSKAMLEVPKILTINSTTMTTLTSTTVMVVGVMRTSMIWKTLLDASLMTSKPHNNTLSTELIKETTQYSTAEEFPSSLPERTSSVFETWTTSNEMTSQETGASTMPSTAGILSEMTTREISTEGAGRSTTQAIATTLPETTSFPFLDTSITEAEGILKDTDTSSATWLPTTVPPLSSMPELSATTASWETTFGVTHDKMSTDLVSPMETHMSSSVGAASSSCNSETTQDSTLEEFPSTLPEHTSLFFETRTTPTERTSQETGAISTLPQSRTTTELPSTTEEETQPDLSTGLVSTGEARTSSSVGATSSFGNSVSTDMAEETTEESTVEDFLTTHPERTASSTLPLSRTTTELPSTAGFLSGISTPEISTEGAGGSTAQDFSTALPETTSSSFVARSTTAYESSTESNAASRTTWIPSSAAPLSSTHVLPKTTESRDTTFGGMQPNMSTGLVSTMKAHTTPSEGATSSPSTTASTELTEEATQDSTAGEFTSTHPETTPSFLETRTTRAEMSSHATEARSTLPLKRTTAEGPSTAGNVIGTTTGGMSTEGTAGSTAEAFSTILPETTSSSLLERSTTPPQSTLEATEASMTTWPTSSTPRQYSTREVPKTTTSRDTTEEETQPDLSTGLVSTVEARTSSSVGATSSFSNSVSTDMAEETTEESTVEDFLTTHPERTSTVFEKNTTPTEIPSQATATGTLKGTEASTTTWLTTSTPSLSSTSKLPRTSPSSNTTFAPTQPNMSTDIISTMETHTRPSVGATSPSSNSASTEQIEETTQDSTVEDFPSTLPERTSSFFETRTTPTERTSHETKASSTLPLSRTTTELPSTAGLLSGISTPEIGTEGAGGSTAQDFSTVLLETTSSSFVARSTTAYESSTESNAASRTTWISSSAAPLSSTHVLPKTTESRDTTFGGMQPNMSTGLVSTMKAHTTPSEGPTSSPSTTASTELTEEATQDSTAGEFTSTHPETTPSFLETRTTRAEMSSHATEARSTLPLKRTTAEGPSTAGNVIGTTTGGMSTEGTAGSTAEAFSTILPETTSSSLLERSTTPPQSTLEATEASMTTWPTSSTPRQYSTREVPKTTTSRDTTEEETQPDLSTGLVSTVEARTSSSVGATSSFSNSVSTDMAEETTEESTVEDFLTTHPERTSTVFEKNTTPTEIPSQATATGTLKGTEASTTTWLTTSTPPLSSTSKLPRTSPSSNTTFAPTQPNMSTDIISTMETHTRPSVGATSPSSNSASTEQIEETTQDSTVEDFPSTLPERTSSFFETRTTRTERTSHETKASSTLPLSRTTTELPSTAGLLSGISTPEIGTEGAGGSTGQDFSTALPETTSSSFVARSTTAYESSTESNVASRTTWISSSAAPLSSTHVLPKTTESRDTTFGGMQPNMSTGLVSTMKAHATPSEGPTSSPSTTASTELTEEATQDSTAGEFTSTHPETTPSFLETRTTRAEMSSHATEARSTLPLKRTTAEGPSTAGNVIGTTTGGMSTEGTAGSTAEAFSTILPETTSSSLLERSTTPHQSTLEATEASMTTWPTSSTPRQYSTREVPKTTTSRDTTEEESQPDLSTGLVNTVEARTSSSVGATSSFSNSVSTDMAEETTEESTVEDFLTTHPERTSTVFEKNTTPTEIPSQATATGTLKGTEASTTTWLTTSTPSLSSTSKLPRTTPSSNTTFAPTQPNMSTDIISTMETHTRPSVGATSPSSNSASTEQIEETTQDSTVEDFPSTLPERTSSFFETRTTPTERTSHETKASSTLPLSRTTTELPSTAGLLSGISTPEIGTEGAGGSTAQDFSTALPETTSSSFVARSTTAYESSTESNAASRTTWISSSAAPLSSTHVLPKTTESRDTTFGGMQPNMSTGLVSTMKAHATPSEGPTSSPSTTASTELTEEATQDSTAGEFTSTHPETTPSFLETRTTRAEMSSHATEARSTLPLKRTTAEGPSTAGNVIGTTTGGMSTEGTAGSTAEAFSTILPETTSSSLLERSTTPPQSTLEATEASMTTWPTSSTPRQYSTREVPKTTTSRDTTEEETQPDLSTGLVSTVEERTSSSVGATSSFSNSVSTDMAEETTEESTVEDFLTTHPERTSTVFEKNTTPTEIPSQATATGTLKGTEASTTTWLTTSTPSLSSTSKLPRTTPSSNTTFAPTQPNMSTDIISTMETHTRPSVGATSPSSNSASTEQIEETTQDSTVEDFPSTLPERTSSFFETRTTPTERTSHETKASSTLPLSRTTTELPSTAGLLSGISTPEIGTEGAGGSTAQDFSTALPETTSSSFVARSTTAYESSTESNAASRTTWISSSAAPLSSTHVLPKTTESRDTTFGGMQPNMSTGLVSTMKAHTTPSEGPTSSPSTTASTELTEEATQDSTAGEFTSTHPETTPSFLETRTTRAEMSSHATEARSTLPLKRTTAEGPSTAGNVIGTTTGGMSTEGTAGSTAEAFSTILPETTSSSLLERSTTPPQSTLEATEASMTTWPTSSTPRQYSTREVPKTTTSRDTTEEETQPDLSTGLVSTVEARTSSSVGATSSFSNSVSTDMTEETTEESTVEDFLTTHPERTSTVFEKNTTPTEIPSQATATGTLKGTEASTTTWLTTSTPSLSSTSKLPRTSPSSNTTFAPTQPNMSTDIISTMETHTRPSVGATSPSSNSASTEQIEETTQDSTVEDFPSTLPERTSSFFETRTTPTERTSHETKASSTLPLSRTTTELPSTAGLLSGISTPEIGTEGAGGSTAQDFSTALPETTSSSFVARSTTAYESSTESNAASRTTWISSSAAPLSSTHVLPKTTESRDTTFGGMQPNMSTGLVSTMKAHTTPSEGPTSSPSTTASTELTEEATQDSTAGEFTSTHPETTPSFLETRTTRAEMSSHATEARSTLPLKRTTAEGPSTAGNVIGTTTGGMSTEGTAGSTAEAFSTILPETTSSSLLERSTTPPQSTLEATEASMTTWPTSSTPRQYSTREVPKTTTSRDTTEEETQPDLSTGLVSTVEARTSSSVGATSSFSNSVSTDMTEETTEESTVEDFLTTHPERTSTVFEKNTTPTEIPSQATATGTLKGTEASTTTWLTTSTPSLSSTSKLPRTSPSSNTTFAPTQPNMSTDIISTMETHTRPSVGATSPSSNSASTEQIEETTQDSTVEDFPSTLPERTSSFFETRTTPTERTSHETKASSTLPLSRTTTELPSTAGLLSGISTPEIGTEGAGGSTAQDFSTALPETTSSSFVARSTTAYESSTESNAASRTTWISSSAAPLSSTHVLPKTTESRDTTFGGMQPNMSTGLVSTMKAHTTPSEGPTSSPSTTASTELTEEATQDSTAGEFTSTHPETTPSFLETRTTRAEMSSHATEARSTLPLKRTTAEGPSTAGNVIGTTTGGMSTEGTAGSTAEAFSTILPETTSSSLLERSTTPPQSTLEATEASMTTWPTSSTPRQYSTREVPKTTTSRDTTEEETQPDLSTGLVSTVEARTSSSMGATSSFSNSVSTDMAEETTEESTVEDFLTTHPERTSTVFEKNTTPTEIPSQATATGTLKGTEASTTTWLTTSTPSLSSTSKLPRTTPSSNTTFAPTQPNMSTDIISTMETHTRPSVGATSPSSNSASTEQIEETTQDSTVEDFPSTLPERTSSFFETRTTPTERTSHETKASSTLPLSRTTTELPSTAGLLSGISTPVISTEGAGGSTAQDFSTVLLETTSSSFVARSTTAYESSTESNAASRTTRISSSAAPLSSTHVLPKTTESRDTTFGGMQPNMSTGLVSTMKAHTTPSEGPTTSSFFETSTTPPQSTLEATEASMTLSEIPSQATATGTLKGTEASTTTFLTPSAPPLSSTSELPKTTSSIAPLSSTHELLTISPSRDTTLNEILSETSTVIPSTVVVHTTLIGLRTTAATSPVSSTFPITSSHPSTSRNDTSFPSPASRSSTSVTTSAIPRPSRTTSKFSSASITMSDVSRISTTTSLVPSTFTIMSNVPIPSMTPSKVPSATTSAITTPSKSTPNDPNVFMTTSAVSSISTFMSGFFSTSVTTSMDLSSTTLTVPSISRSTFSSTSMATSTLPSSSATTSTVPSTFTTTSAVPRTLTTSTVPSSTTSTVPVSSMTTSTVPSISTTRSAHPSISMTSAASRTSMSTFAFPRSSTTTSTVPHTSRTTSAVPPATRTTSAPPSTPRTTVPATSKVPNTLTTTSTIPSTATLTTTAVLCYNGGFHDGVKCICPDNLFYGPKCEFPVPDFVPPEVPVAVRVEAQVRISNGEYTSALENPNSEDYQKLEKDFKSKMDEVYKDLLGYREVVILRLRKGSIIVDHEVVVETMVKSNMSDLSVSMQNVTEAVRDQLTNFNRSEKNCTLEICFTVSPDSIRNSTFSIEDSCKNVMQFPEFAAFYYPLVVDGVLRCVSDCSSESPHAIDCHHGTCHIRGGGPQCDCNEMGVFWYLDNHLCQSRIRKSELGLGLGLGTFAVASLILALLLFRAKRRKSPSSWPDDAEAWYEEVDDWTPPGALVFSNKDADVWEGSWNSREVFRPSLQAVDPFVKVQFQRPIIVSDC
ncbi:uncharacterized protein LOC143825059 [Paroedura picta]|uniref:uncharacterized protein LOC143825059 n=1 Tax=Paroedura picta TaxID=143630 RepID=UPI004056FDAC